MPPAGRALDRRRQATSQASIGRQPRAVGRRCNEVQADHRRLRQRRLGAFVRTRRVDQCECRLAKVRRLGDQRRHHIGTLVFGSRPDSRSARPVSALVWPGQDAPMTFRATRNAQWARSDLSLQWRRFSGALLVEWSPSVFSDTPHACHRVCVVHDTVPYAPPVICSIHRSLATPCLAG